MTEEKYNTKDIRHINEKNQEYIAENNRMTEKIELTTEVLNCDYFNRNRGFNCYKGKNCTEVPDCYYKQLKRLEQENKELKAYKDVNEDFKKAWDELNEKHKRCRSALNTIQRMVLSAWEQGKYLDGGLFECLTKEFSKINGI